MKLTPEQLGQPEPSTPTNTLQMALRLASDGWHVFPISSGSKMPLLPKAHDVKKNPELRRCRGECGRDGHGAWDGTTDPDKIRKWWGNHPTANIGANLGDDRIAFDVDLNHGGTFLQSFPTTRRHLSGRGNGNAHLIYNISGSALAQAIRGGNGTSGGLGDGMDIKVGRGMYIIMPGSRHEETGKLYTLEPDHDEHMLTDDEVQAIYDEAGVALSATARGAAKGISAVTGAKPRPTGRSGPQMLSELLQNPPERGSGQANDWLTRVAGHYAKMHRDKRDLYEVEVRRAADLMGGYEDTEKVLESIWSTETEEHPERAATLNNGWLVGNDRALFCQISQKVGDDTIFTLSPYADFDIEARGVAVDDNNHRAYWVRIKWRGQEIDATLDGETLGDDRALRRWLAAFGATIDPPFQAYPKTSPGVRIQRYLESQDPSPVNIVDTLGWHEDLHAFVTHEGIITAEGPATKEQAGVVANPQLIIRDVAPYKYGFEGTYEEAVEVLREVMTFQTPEVVAVFGAWWAACLLKPQIQTQTSIFPFFGIEAASESGKTNGYFRLMVGLNGNTRGQVAPTKPVLRDSASANRNGIVWADDLDDLTAYGEILRASTSNGTASKMDMDRNGIRNTQIVAPILISGEQLGMGTQKALADRSIIIPVPSPTERMSLKPGPKRIQWFDVMDLTNRFSGVDGLAAIAGWFQSAALQRVEETLLALAESKKTGKGRHGDKVAVLMAGAALLDSLLGAEGAWEGQGPTSLGVAAWATAHEGGLIADNTLTMEVLPWAMRIYKNPDAPQEYTMGRFQGIDTPVFVRWTGEPTLDAVNGAEVWISASLLADAWARDHNHRVDARTATKTALSQQADRVCEVGTSKPFKVSGTARTGRYRKLLPEYARLVLARVDSEPTQ